MFDGRCCWGMGAEDRDGLVFLCLLTVAASGPAEEGV